MPVDPANISMAKVAEQSAREEPAVDRVRTSLNKSAGKVQAPGKECFARGTTFGQPDLVTSGLILTVALGMACGSCHGCEMML